MPFATDDESSRRLTGSDAFFFGVLTIGFAALAAIFIWGLHDAGRERSERLNQDTRAPQILPVSAGRYSPTSAEEFAAFYPSSLKAHAGDTVRFTNPTIEDPHSSSPISQPAKGSALSSHALRACEARPYCRSTRAC